jgi:type II secretory pathway pseudopilin PulG
VWWRRRVVEPVRPARSSPSRDDGFSLIEVVVALGLVLAVMATTAGFFVTSLKQSNGQTQAQQAAVLADQQLDYTRSVAGASLLSGRTQAAVQAVIAGAPVGVDLSQDVTATGNWDTSNPPATTASVPITMHPSVGGTTYTVTTLIDRCYLSAASSTDCKAQVTSFGWVYRITVDVTYSLEGGRSCANGKPCYYVASTLRDSGSDPCFNVNPAFAGCSTSQPTITSISPNTATTNAMTTVALTGTHFDSGASVSLDAGGTASNVVVTSSTSLTFTLTTDNTAAAVGSRTVKVANPNGKFAYGTITITQAGMNVTAVSPSPLTAGTTSILTISGTGFQSGSVVSIPSSAGTINGTPTFTATSITMSFSAGSAATAIGTWPVTVTNPDGGSDSANLTIQRSAINVTGVSPSTMTPGSTRSFTISGTGFNSGAQVTLDGANVNETWDSATMLTVTLGSDPGSGTHTFVVTNPDGGSDSVNFAVVAIAHITSVSPGSITHNRSVTVTITGSNFVTSGGVSPSVSVNRSTNGVSSVNIVSSTKVTFKYRITNTRGVYTYPVQVTSEDGTVSDAFDWVVTSS